VWTRGEGRGTLVLEVGGARGGVGCIGLEANRRKKKGGGKGGKNKKDKRKKQKEKREKKEIGKRKIREEK
jgi:hypothetical protein